MVDSTCVMPSFFHSSNQQGHSIVPLEESVSFGKFTGQNLEWDKYSAFNQNRYLEEAQRLAKPGLVAQRKALFEAHFKKPGAEKAPGLFKVGNLDTKNEVSFRRNDFNKENFYGEPCKDMSSAQSKGELHIKAAKSETDYLWRVDHPPAHALIESHSGEVLNSFKSDATAENKNSQDFLVQLDGPGHDKGASDLEDLKESEHLDSLHDTIALNQSKFVDTLTSSVAIRLDKFSVQEPMQKFVFASTVDFEPALSSSNSSTSVKKRAVLSPCKLRSQVRLMKENNAPEISKASGTGMVTRKRVVTKPLDVPIKQNSTLPAMEKPLTVKELESVKYPVNSVSARGSKVRSDQVTADLDGSEAISSNNKLSAEPDLKPAPTQLKQKTNITRSSMTSMRKTVGQKERSKWNTSAFSQITGTKSVLTSSAMSKTFSSRAQKHTLPSSNMSSIGRKSTIQSHAESQNKYGSKVIQMNSALKLSQNNLKKPLPRAVHVSVGPSFNFGSVKMPTSTPKCRSRIMALDARVYKESSNRMRESLRKSLQTSATRQFVDKGSKRPNTRLHEPSSVIQSTKRTPTTTTVFTPFRFRSDERAAIRRQKFEFNNSAEAENSSQIKRKVGGLSNNKIQVSNSSKNKR